MPKYKGTNIGRQDESQQSIFVLISQKTFFEIFSIAGCKSKIFWYLSIQEFKKQ
jgi:hypothetical protein